MSFTFTSLSSPLDDIIAELQTPQKDSEALNLADNITEILKENLDDDYEDMERPEYDAMLYALRDIKDLLENRKILK